ncbi:N-acetyltransferase DgcN [Oceanibacterium hippocampi]|uniref:EBNA-1 nuclear protein n=1 Tax=Oceanibacterium hippocampi TaxID=745714 RepID=A0A1Y5TSF2_9PROT|nr:N-acetyltransferase DgcN [Oceanibacterium hippocampi]SLN70350.1 hypothetical protein OCH7691_03281 [Oceanibacterium hippocampi]
MDSPYLLFLGDVPDQLSAKTAEGVVRWRPERVLGQNRMEGCGADLGVADISIPHAAAKGAKTMIVGVANSGGVLPGHWSRSIVEAMELGMDVASGLHMRLADQPEIAEAAARTGRKLYDVRHPTRQFPTGKGTRRTGKRLLTVGTDCSVGKMFTTLALEKEMRKRDFKADFRATGQTGILITGEGVSIDAVVADFISGAVEWLSPDNDPDHWDLIEGQGSLFHPSFAGVSLGLLHGAQADVLIMCHEPTRPHMRGIPGRALPSIQTCIDANLQAARLTNSAVQCIGIAVNTSGLDPAAARDYLAATEETHGLPCVDPARDGVARLVDRLS